MGAFAEAVCRPNDILAFTFGGGSGGEFPYYPRIPSLKFGLSLSLNRLDTDRNQYAFSLWYTPVKQLDQESSRAGITFGAMPNSLSVFKWSLGVFGIFDSYNPLKKFPPHWGPIPILEASWRIY